MVSTEGEATIAPAGGSELRAACDTTTTGGGWTLLQVGSRHDNDRRRMDTATGRLST